MENNSLGNVEKVLEVFKSGVFQVETLGKRSLKSPILGRIFVEDQEKVALFSKMKLLDLLKERQESMPSFEMAGPREMIYHDPSWTKAAILTCGGLCPGLNNVIRSAVHALWYQYEVKHIFGLRYGYQGLNPEFKHEPLLLTPEIVEKIHEEGGTILGSSRGNQPIDVMVDTLERLNINLLFCVGGDGTLKGAAAIAEEIKKRGRKISVIGIPKTIDNDLGYIERSFGFETAVYKAYDVISSAYNEARGAYNGIGLVKLMGRDSGFIAEAASAANCVVDFCLVPELEFKLEGENGFLKALERCLEKKKYAVVVVAEGTGQEFFKGKEEMKDASGNVLHKDIGLFLKYEIAKYFKEQSVSCTVKYFDPSYLIRSIPAQGFDAIFCNFLAEQAVHAGMAGKTSMVVGFWNNLFTHVPIKLMVKERNKINTNGFEWQALVSATRQTEYFNGDVKE